MADAGKPGSYRRHLGAARSAQGAGRIEEPDDRLLLCSDGLTAVLDDVPV